MNSLNRHIVLILVLICINQLVYAQVSNGEGFEPLEGVPSPDEFVPPIQNKQSINSPILSQANAVVNGVAIPQAQVDLLIKAAALQGKPDTPEQRKSTQDYLVNREIMAQEAIQRGYNKQPETISQFELARQTVLVNAFLQDHIKSHPVTEDAIKKEYEALKRDAGSREYNLRHILAKDESEAKSIATQVMEGANFENLAKKYSLDPGSKDKGGSLGWVMPTNFIPAFADAFVNLKKGGVSSPIKVEDGWHLIKVDDVRDFKFPSYNDLKAKITLSLQQQGIQKTIAEMRAKVKIETPPQAQVDLLIKAAALQGKPDTPEQRKSTQDYLVNREIMAQEAIQRGYNKQPETISQFELARQTVLVNAFLQDHIKSHPVTEDAIKKEYEALKRDAGSNKLPSYRDLKGKIMLSLQQKGIQKTIVDMRAKAKIE